jgi:phosphatidylglycerol---prolipoprotein diacylglyceryl transferase
MYPTISDALKDIFGIKLPLPVQSFGFFVAISFIAAAWVLLLELKRKEKIGVLSTIKRKVLVGKPAGIQEIVLMALVGFILGYKFLGIILDYTYFADNPQVYVFSTDGSFIGGILGAVIAAYLRYYEKQKHKLPTPRWDDLEIHPYELTGNYVMYAALFGILGAKIFHNLENMDEFIRDPMGSIFSFSGLTFYGGLIVAAAFLIWYSKKNNIPALVICDTTAPALMLGYALGRIGCQIAGDGDWGIVNQVAQPHWLSFLPNWVWSYDYPHNVINEGVQIAGCVGKHCFHLVPPVYPTPIYEITVCLILFFGLWIFRHRMKTAGVMFSIYLIVNGVERFFIEKIRVNTKYHIFGNEITQAEIISTILFFAGIALLIYVLRKAKSDRIKASAKQTSDDIEHLTTNN